MPEPSNSNLFNSGSITIKPDLSRYEMKLGIHHTTIHLQPDEGELLILNLMHAGLKLWGVDWLKKLCIDIEQLPLSPTKISFGGED